MLYELTTLSHHPLHTAQVAANAHAWVRHRDALGTLLGCWFTDIGPLGRLLVLRGFARAEDLARERQRALHHENPFGAGGLLTGMEMDSYQPFPFLPEVQTGAFGKVYEFRTYLLKPGGLPPTIEFAQREIAPMAQELHLAGAQIPEAVLAKMQDMGIFGVAAPTDLDGLGMGALGAAVVTEELSRAWTSARCPCTTGRVRSDLEAGMAKLFASEVVQFVCHEALQIHGGMGFAVETPVNRYWRDSALASIGDGTSEIQREVIARRLLQAD